MSNRIVMFHSRTTSHETTNALPNEQRADLRDCLNATKEPIEKRKETVKRQERISRDAHPSDSQAISIGPDRRPMGGVGSLYPGAIPRRDVPDHLATRDRERHFVHLTNGGILETDAARFAQRKNGPLLLPPLEQARHLEASHGCVAPTGPSESGPRGRTQRGYSR